jgi:hypothetical protein
MLKSYFNVALRNIARHKAFSILNIFGLALGMSVSLLLISFYAYVSSFDDFHTKKQNIYRIISALEKGLRRDDLAISLPLPQSLLKNCNRSMQVNWKSSALTQRSEERLFPISSIFHFRAITQTKISSRFLISR